MTGKGTTGLKWRKNSLSYEGRQRMFYVFKVLMDARENDGRNKGFTTREFSVLTARMAYIDDKVDFALEIKNMHRSLLNYKKWGYVTRTKGGRWIFDYSNWQNTRYQSRGALNRVDWKYRELVKEAREKNWPCRPDYMEA